MPNSPVLKFFPPRADDPRGSRVRTEGGALMRTVTAKGDRASPPRRARRAGLALLWVLGGAGLVGAGLAGAEVPADADSPFPRPAALEPAVRFWERVYSGVTTRGGLIHDDLNLGVVYEQIDFPADVDPRVRSQEIDAAKAKYQRILRELGSGRRADLSDEERRVLLLWPAGVDNATLTEAASHVRFQLGQADRFREGLQRAGAWGQHIREVLRREGVPEELSALPHVESSFNAQARSKVGAAGMWQFMPATAHRWLRVDGVVDERLDPYKSAEAAAQYLSRAYEALGSWPLALTAYNHGTGGMLRAKNQLGTEDITAIVRNYQSPTFGFASRNFYVSFLAALEIDRNYERFFGPLDRNARDTSRVLKLPEYIPLRALERVTGVEHDTLRRLNLALLDPVWSGERFVPKGFEFRVPASAGEPREILARVEPTEMYAAQRRDTAYRVGKHETLGQIAAREGTTTQELLALNHLSSGSRLKKGMVLKLPEQRPIGSTRDRPLAALPAPGSGPSAP